MSRGLNLNNDHLLSMQVLSNFTYCIAVANLLYEALFRGQEVHGGQRRLLHDPGMVFHERPPVGLLRQRAALLLVPDLYKDPFMTFSHSA